MYKEFFQLNENPFNMTADPDFFFSSEKHSEAFASLMYGIHHRKGILVVTGEIGTGKTTLCRTLLNRLDKTIIKTALILNPTFSDIQLLQLIVNDLGIEGKFRNKLQLITALNEFLLEQTSLGNNVVLIIDEAQNLGVRQLEQIRLLSNLETEKEKLLQIILIGQPELCEKLKLPALRQLTQRICVRYHILPLERNEMSSYIQHRINVAQSSPDNSIKACFTEEALDIIFKSSKGAPRMVNILCDRALLAGYSQSKHKIDEDIIHKCIQEVTYT